MFKNNLSAFKQDKTIRLANRFYLGILLVGLLAILLAFKRLPPQVPLFYSLPWGEEQLTSPSYLLILPAGCLLTGILNLFLAVVAFGREPLAAKILLWFNVALTFLATLTLMKIIFLII